MPDKNQNYWNKRKHLRYYSAVREMVQQYAPEAQSLLDVGTGPTLYLNEYQIPEIVVVDKDQWAIHRQLKPFVQVAPRQKFEEYESDRTFDVVMCLQCLEHIDAQARPVFIEKLQKHCNGILLISLPYKWSGTKLKGHNGIDEAVIKSWMGEDPVASRIVTEDNGGQRIINIY